MKNKSIKGLIIKDLLNLSHYKFSLFVIVIIFLGLGMSSKETLNFLPIMLMTMLGMIGLSTFSYDELSKADKYLLALPTNKKELVKAKYLLSIIMILIGAIISIIATMATNYIIFQERIEPLSIMSMLVGGIFGISLVECIQIPSVYKWGAEKGRIQMFVLIILVSGLIGGGIFLLTKHGFNLQFDTNGILEIIKNFGMFIAIAVIFLMYFLSYQLSCKIYSKKDI